MSKVYIELGEAINAIKSSRGNCDHRFYDEGLMDACSELIGLKPADVEPVRHGEWIDKCVRDWHCSLCDCEIQKVRKVDGYYYDDLPNYCPECGAKMDGGN